MNESVVETAILEWFSELGFETRYWPDVAHDWVSPEGTGYEDVVLDNRLKSSLARINPNIPAEGTRRINRKRRRCWSSNRRKCFARELRRDEIESPIFSPARIDNAPRTRKRFVLVSSAKLEEEIRKNLKGLGY